MLELLCVGTLSERAKGKGRCEHREIMVIMLGTGEKRSYLLTGYVKNDVTRSIDLLLVLVSLMFWSWLGILTVNGEFHPLVYS